MKRWQQPGKPAEKGTLRTLIISNVRDGLTFGFASVSFWFGSGRRGHPRQEGVEGDRVQQPPRVEKLARADQVTQLDLLIREIGDALRK